MPYKSSSKEYSLGLIDRDIVKRYRLWLVEHFKNEFQYEPLTIFPLAKVREAISGAMILGRTQNDYEQQLKQREFDLLVRVDEIKVEKEVSAAKEESKIAEMAGSPIKQLLMMESIPTVILKISDQSCV